MNEKPPEPGLSGAAPDMEKYRREQEQQAKANADNAEKYFPFPLVKTPGDKAYETFERIRSEGKDTPVILGGAEGFGRMADVFHESWPADMRRTPAVILGAASKLSHPRDIVGWEAANMREALAKAPDRLAAIPDAKLPAKEKGGRKLSPDEVRKQMLEDQRKMVQEMISMPPDEPDMGEWPGPMQPQGGPGAVRDILTGKFFDTVYIARLPTRDWTEAPAYLDFGNWNACPPPEHHVAAFRSWRDKYGAELVAITGDVVEMRTARAPKTRDEALALGREFYSYCPDIIEQGFGGLAPLAAQLMAGGWWYFWWD